MAKYLDQAGLQVLWSISKETFESQGDLTELLKNYVTNEALATDLTNYVKKNDFESFKKIVSDAGEALIFNEADGGGVKFTDKNGNASFVGVNQDVDGGIGAQLYDINMATNKGSKLDVTKNGIYYVVGDESAKPAVERDIAANELATKKDIQAIAHPEYSMRKDENPGDFAAVYHLTKDGEDIGEAINIAKDQLLKSVEVKTCTEKDVPISGLNVGDKYIDFTFIVEGGAEAHSYIAVKDMVKPYTAGNGIIIDSENAISVDTNVIASKEYVDDVADVAKAYIDQEVADEKAERIAADESLAAEVAKRTIQTIVGANGTSMVWNEASGGGAHFTQTNGAESFVGVNDGTDGLMAQIYADVQENGKWVGSRINAYNDKIYYTNKADVAGGVARNDAAHEIATIGDVEAHEPVSMTEADIREICK